MRVKKTRVFPKISFMPKMIYIDGIKMHITKEAANQLREKETGGNLRGIYKNNTRNAKESSEISSTGKSKFPNCRKY